MIGFLLLLFGLKWLKNAIQRYSGLKFLHDEEAIYAARVVEASARGEPVKIGLAPFGVLLSYKSVLLEGLEVAFIVISFGGSGVGGIGTAALGAGAAGVLVILIGITLTMVILALIHFEDALAFLRGALGLILIIGVLATLVATLGKCPTKWFWLTFGDVCCSSHIDRSFYRKKKTFVEGSCKDESEASTCSAGGIRSNRY